MAVSKEEQLQLARSICIQRCYIEATGSRLRYEDANLAEQLGAWLETNPHLVPCDENGEIAPSAADFADAATGFEDDPNEGED